MPRLLVINPNTTASITDLVLGHVRRVAPSGVEITGATGRFGEPYIASEVSFAIGSHAAIDAYRAHGAGAHAVLLACFGDPGYFALCEESSVPVVGLAAQCMKEAAALGRFAIVTGGRAWAPMLERFAAQLGLRAALAGVETVGLSGAQIAAEPERSIAELATAVRRAAELADVRVVILGGAGLAGLAGRVQAVAQVPVPVWDSVEVGARAATARLGAGPKR